MTWWQVGVGLVVAISGAVVAALRWWRVAQREHYLPGSVVRFLARWWRSTPANVALGLVGLGALVGAIALPDLGLVWVLLAGGASVVFPIGLPVRGTTSPLAWTDRLRRIAWGTGAIVAVVFGVLWWLVDPGVALVVLPLVVAVATDAALAVLAPYERRASRQWIERARAGLRMVDPRVVAITGSYGKTTAKEYARRVLASAAPTVASPASFNNAMGLARAINEGLAPGTEWFIAEMGTYGPGEIAEMCSWIPPDISAITAIGPVHLERFGDLDTTLASKAEIAERAEVVVLNVDDPRLAGLATSLEASGKRVVKVGVESPHLDVRVSPVDDGWAVEVGGVHVGDVPPIAFPTNLAVAVGIGVAAGIPLDGLGSAFDGAVTPDHRQTVARGPGGFWVVDDTFNSNPAGAAAALEKLEAAGIGRKVVVTPGMVELGHEQADANEAFGEAAATVADDLIIVRRTNRAALRRGGMRGTANVRFARDRDEAIEWVRATLVSGDAVLYENDLPDHYP
jgi:UDP-N-acetylmuramoyl-tripeptide--D-alanyl-D-alanine ligase